MISGVSIEVLDKQAESPVLQTAGGGLPPIRRTGVGSGDIDGGKFPPNPPTAEEDYSDWTSLEKKLMERFSHLPSSVFTLPGRRILAFNMVPLEEFLSVLDLSLDSEVKMAAYKYGKLHLVGSFYSDPRLLFTDGVVLRLGADESTPKNIDKEQLNSTYMAWVGRNPTPKDSATISIVSPLRKPELRSRLNALNPRYLSI